MYRVGLEGSYRNCKIYSKAFLKPEIWMQSIGMNFAQFSGTWN